MRARHAEVDPKLVDKDERITTDAPEASRETDARGDDPAGVALVLHRLDDPSIEEPNIGPVFTIALPAVAPLRRVRSALAFAAPSCREGRWRGRVRHVRSCPAKRRTQARGHPTVGQEGETLEPKARARADGGDVFA
jgi:hypothetical protein